MKRNVKLFSIILALICAFSTLSMMAVSAEAPAYVEIPEGAETVTVDGAEYTVIRTAEEMNANADAKINLILANDLDYTGLEFKKIRLNGTTVNGNGYAIYGFSLTGTNDISAFGADNAAGFNVIKNLTIGQPNNKVQIKSETSGKSVGTILGYSNAKHTIENVTVYADISTVNGNTGGFGGNIKGTLNMKNCAFYGTITDKSGNPNGGLIGKTNSLVLTMENCCNYGTIDCSADAAGIIAKTSGTGIHTLTNCANFGTIKGSSAAGIIGSHGTNSEVTVEGCLNAGTVNAVNNGGGLLGWSHADRTISFTNCVNIGVITSNGKAGGLGAFSYQKHSYNNCGSFGSVASAGTECGVFFGQNDATTGTATNLFYTPIENTTNSILVEGATQKTLAEAIAWTNELIGANVGNLVLNTAGNGAVLAAPKFAGVQESAVAEGTFDVRFVATLNDSLNYSAVGFEVALVGGKTVTKECGSVYGKLLSTTEQGFDAEVTAAQLQGTYLFALAIENVPATGTVTFTVTPYAKALDGTTVYSGASYNVTYANGVYVGISACV